MFFTDKYIEVKPLFSSILCTVGILQCSFLAWPRKAILTQYSDTQIYLDFQIYTSLAICQKFTSSKNSRVMSPVLTALEHRLQPHHLLILYFPLQCYKGQIPISHVITKTLGYRKSNILVISLTIRFEIGKRGKFFQLPFPTGFETGFRWPRHLSLRHPQAMKLVIAALWR